MDGRMKLSPIAITLSMLFVLGCKPDTQNTQSALVASAVTQTNQANETNKKQIINLLEFPVYVDEKVPTLLHPIMQIGTDESGSYSISKMKGKGSQGYFSASGTFQYQTHIHNLVFEHIESGETQKLFEHNNFVIHNLYYPHVTEEMEPTKEVQQDGENISVTAKKPKVRLFGHVIFHVQEQLKPIDEDSKSNLHQQHSLYMTNVLGKNRIKLHPDNEYVTQTKWLPDVARYYFMTKTDSDKNGIIDSKDARKNYVIDFKKENPSAIAYDFDNA